MPIKQIVVPNQQSTLRAAWLRAAAAGPGFAAQFITPFTQFRMENFC